jgi:putative oxidoreductase
MKIIANLAGVLLGAIFLEASGNYFFHFYALKPLPPGSPPAMFLGAMVPTGYFTFVKCLETTGGMLVLFPRTRPLGLLILGPIVVNILCFHILLFKGVGVFPLPTIVALLSLFLLWVNRAAFRNLLPWSQAAQAVAGQPRITPAPLDPVPPTPTAS